MRCPKWRNETGIYDPFLARGICGVKKHLLQQPTLSYEETVSVARQLDLAGQISSNQVGQENQENTRATTSSLSVTQLMEHMDTLSRKISELSQSVANVNATSTQDTLAFMPSLSTLKCRF